MNIKKLICWSFCVGIIYMLGSNIYAIDMSGLMNKVKQNIQPSEDTKNNQSIQTNQKTSSDIKQTEQIEEDSVSATRNRDSGQNAPREIIDEGVFCIEQEMVTPIEEGKPFTVFDIPLNAPIQDVVNALELKGIKIKDIEGYGSVQDCSDAINNAIEEGYKRKRIAGKEKEDALKVISEDKIKFFSFTDSHGGKYYLLPVSAEALLTEDQMERPVFAEYYANYNSLFRLRLPYGAIPDDMKAQGIGEASVFFVSINQQEPKSFCIHLSGGNPKLVNTLNKKYGMPKFYYFQIPDAYDYRNLYTPQIEYLKTKSKESTALPPRELLYNDIIQFLAVATYSYTFFRGVDAFPQYSINDTAYECLFEWNYGEYKILNKSSFDNTTANGELVSGNKLTLGTSSVTYMHFPTVIELSKQIKQIFLAAKEVDKKVKDNTSSGF